MNLIGLPKHLRAYAKAFLNIVKTLNLSAVPLTSNPRKLFDYSQASLFYRKQVSGQGLPSMEIQEFFGSEIYHTEVILSYNTHDRWYSRRSDYLKDMIALCLICKAIKPTKIFEIGTSVGVTAQVFACNSEPNCLVYTLDLPLDYDTSTLSLDTTIVDENVMKHRRVSDYVWENLPKELVEKINPLHGDSATFDFSPYENQVDIFYIDGSHSYEYVKSDTSKAFECIKSEGVIVWHDYGRDGINGVTRYLDELSKKIQIFRVPGSSVAFTRVD